ncbi:3-oxoacyl-[acyl-carrier-protein] reductase [bacterium]|nr:3-oxoacyl-[acyl-carrier-protein] reductase [bacterium]MCP5462499.1 3-oxoacyl-[acyl-carrier-protein] reductase [bacterium]
MNLTGKNALITGGARGIGKTIAETLAQHGARVILCDIDESIGKGTIDEFSKKKYQSDFFQVDVSSFESVSDTVAKILDKYNVIDILVNNAGITRDQLLLKMTESEWDQVISVNLKGTFNFCKALYRHMMKNRGGKIINIASIIGLIGNAGQANYAASKAGVIGFTKSIARELGPRGVCVNAIAPGFIQTAMTDVLKDEVKEKMLAQIPLGTFGATADVANAVLFLSSELSSYITGHVLNVSGGMVM